MGWELFRRDTHGYEVVGVDGDLLIEAPLPEYPVACEVIVDAPSALPNVLSETETALEQVVAAVRGRLAATVRSHHRLWNLIALPSEEPADEFGTLPLSDKAKITVVPTRDPDWTIFEGIRPVGIEQQSMEDLRIVRNLHDDGDSGCSRQILHVAHDLVDGEVQPFVASMISLGYRTEVEADELGVLVIHNSEPSEVTPDSWTIRQVARRHGGRYDGWRCEVIRTPPKKRWFSRSSRRS